MVKVFPSPVLISAILPWCKATPPINWTLKCLSFLVLLAASLTKAKASGSNSSKDFPFLIWFLNSSVFFGKSESLKFLKFHYIISKYYNYFKNIRLRKPSNKTKKNSNLFKFEKFISKRFNKNFNENFKKIHDWSVKNQGDFWSSVWDFSKVKGLSLIHIWRCRRRS